MATRLIIDGNAVYEIDEDCLECQKKKTGYRDSRFSGTFRSMDQPEKAQETQDDKSK